MGFTATIITTTTPIGTTSIVIITFNNIYDFDVPIFINYILCYIKYEQCSWNFVKRIDFALPSLTYD